MLPCDVCKGVVSLISIPCGTRIWEERGGEEGAKDVLEERDKEEVPGMDEEEVGGEKEKLTGRGKGAEDIRGMDENLEYCRQKLKILTKMWVEELEVRGEREEDREEEKEEDRLEEREGGVKQRLIHWRSPTQRRGSFRRASQSPSCQSR